MAAKKRSKGKNTVTIELELDVLKKLLAAAEALSELANCSIMGCDDPKVRSLGKGKRKPAKKRAKARR